MLSPIQCAQFERMLEEQPDGPLSAGAAAHLEGCTDCRVLWSDMEAIRAAGMEWGKEEVEPPEYLWISLRRTIGIGRVDTRKADAARLVLSLVWDGATMDSGRGFYFSAAHWQRFWRAIR